ncbi:MAG TPA: hypothetical protein VKA55_06915 [Gammaproteobacteria bacterium]|nr:hypothetical protein [Gammaproteobacteria bacterium]
MKGMAPIRLALTALLLLAPLAAARAAPEIQGVYSLKLGQTRAEAESTLAGDDRFDRIAGRHYKDFPLYDTTLGGHEMRVRPTFEDGKLVEIELRFRQIVSPNDVTPVIRDQVRFAVDALSQRFGEPDRQPIPVERIDPRVFEDGGRVVSHQWRRGQRLAEVDLWRERFDFGAAIVLAEQHTREQADSAAEAF